MAAGVSRERLLAADVLPIDRGSSNGGPGGA
jgi:hypothetical protein